MHRCLALLVALTSLVAIPTKALADTAPPTASIAYPVSRTVDHVDEYHGVQVHDPYRWLEDVDSDETANWVKAQNEVTFGWLGQIAARDVIRARLTELWDYPRYGTPWRRGDRTFFEKNDGLQNQYVLYVQDGPEGEPRILLDPNLLSEDGTVSLGIVSVSEDGRYLAWSTSVSGSDWREWRVRDIDTGEDLPDLIQWSKFSGASWIHDGSGFFYGGYDEPNEGEELEQANYFQKLYFHRIGTSQNEDVLVYERPDEKTYGFSGHVTEDGSYLIIHVWKGTDERNLVYYKDLRDPHAEVVRLLDDFDASYAFVGNDEGRFYFRTNLRAPKGRLIAIDTAHPERESWTTLIPESEDVLEQATIINETFLATYMHHARDQVRVFDLEGHHLRDVELPSLGRVGGPQRSRVFEGRRHDTDAFYSFTSFLYPSTVLRYDCETGQSTVVYDSGVDFDVSGYETKQVFCTSRDGTQIPVFLVHKRGIELDGNNPTYLYGYGGFNIPMLPRFSISRLVWLEMGGVYAHAILRGGGEYGEEWHQAGSLLEKQNTFDDFIAAGEWLVENGYTSPRRLAIAGGSNGGTLVGAVLNQRPDLFGAALPAVGVMDMLRFQHFTIGWAWVSDYGSSADPEQFEVLRSYSPYHNIVEGGHYPATLITTADHDDRVFPAHSFKYAAQLQAAQAGDPPILIRIQTKAGHGGGKPTSKIIEEEADRWAFLMRVFEMEGDQAF